MTFSASAVEEAISHRAAIAELLAAPSDWWDTGSFESDPPISVYKWFHTENSRMKPSSLGMYDSVVKEFYPDYESQWSHSGLRNAIQLSKGSRYDVTPTIEVMEGWIRNPFVWDDIAVESSGVIRFNQIRYPVLPALNNGGLWGLFCRALGTAESPMPKGSMLYLSDKSNFGAMRSISGFPMDMFVEAAISTNYDEMVVAPFIAPTIDATTAYKFWNNLDPKYGNQLLWFAVLASRSQFDELYNHEPMKLVEDVIAMSEQKLTPESYIRWYHKGIALDQMLQFSFHEVDEEIIDSLVSDKAERS